MEQTIKYAVQPDGTGCEVFVGLPIPEHMVEVPSAPEHGWDIWNFSTGSWTPYVPPVAYPPLTRRQLKLMLYNVGITEADVDAEISAIADPSTRDLAMIQWKDASQFKRDHHLIAQMAGAFSLSDTQVDSLWLAAADL